jgi:hypothetical protein
MPQEKKPFYVVLPGWLGGQLSDTGDKIELTEAEAKYLVLSGQITDRAPAQAYKKAASSKSDKTEESDA